MPKRIAVAIILLVSMIGTFFSSGILSQSKAYAQNTTVAANITGWPVDGSVGTWVLENGYKDCSLGETKFYDHGLCTNGGNSSQLYGFDLVLDGQTTHGQNVISPITGKVAYGIEQNKNSTTNVSLGIFVSSAPGLIVSIVHLDTSLRAGDPVNVGQVLGQITHQGGNSHLHFSLYRQSDRSPIPFMNDTQGTYGGYNTQIQMCPDFKPDGNGASDANGTVNQFGDNLPISCGLTTYGWWMRPTPTGTSQESVHLYGSPATRSINLGYNTSDTNGKKVDHVDFWNYQNSKWNWMGSRTPDGNHQEFITFSLTGPAYIATDVLTTDGVWHEANDGIRAICVAYPNASNPTCPPATNITYHDGNSYSTGTGGGGAPGDSGQSNGNQPPTATDGIKICSGANYGGTCNTFTYTGDNGTVQALGSLSHNQDSMQFLGSYVNAYDVVFCLRDGCPSGDREIQHDDPNFDNSITKNQYVAIRIVKNAPPLPQTPGVEICSGKDFSGECIILPVGEFNRGDSGAWSKGTNAVSVRYVNGWDSTHYHIRLWTERDWNRTGNQHVGTPYNVDRDSIGDLDNKDGNNPNPGNNFDSRIQSAQIYQEQPPNAPDSPTPADGTMLPSGTTSLDLSWNGGDKSVIHIWNDSGWNYQNDWSANSISFTNLAPGKYAWQTKSINRIGEGPWSNIWTFTVQSSGPPTPLPEGSIKEGGLNLDAYCQSINLPVSGVINGVWYCGNGTLALDLTKACQWQYTDTISFSFEEQANNAYSWNCYRYPRPNTPTNLLPSSGTTLISSTRIVHLSWAGSDSSQYHVWSENPFYDNIGQWFNGDSADVLLPRFGLYHWQVQTQNNGGFSEGSQIFSFTIVAPSPTVPNAPADLSPSNHSVLASSTQKVHLSWTGSDSSEYHIWSTDANYENWSSWFNGDSVDFIPNGPGIYSWEVWTSNSSGISTASNTSSFTISKPNPKIFENFSNGKNGWVFTNSVVNSKDGSNGILRFTNPSKVSTAVKAVNNTALSQYNTITIRINLHGATLPTGSGAQLFLDQSGIKYVPLSTYVKQKVNGWQTVTIPLSAFKGFDNTKSFAKLGISMTTGTKMTIDFDDITFLYR